MPPAGHRIVLQLATGNEVVACVYDRANAPESVLEILRLGHSGIRPLTLDFSPQKKWPLTELSERAFLQMQFTSAGRISRKPQYSPQAPKDI
jgi:hypothetical protein